MLGRFDENVSREHDSSHEEKNRRAILPGRQRSSGFVHRRLPLCAAVDVNEGAAPERIWRFSSRICGSLLVAYLFDIVSTSVAAFFDSQQGHCISKGIAVYFSSAVAFSFNEYNVQ